jgi:hypothetical protein
MYEKNYIILQCKVQERKRDQLDLSRTEVQAPCKQVEVVILNNSFRNSRKKACNNLLLS